MPLLSKPQQQKPPTKIIEEKKPKRTTESSGISNLFDLSNNEINKLLFTEQNGTTTLSNNYCTFRGGLSNNKNISVKELSLKPKSIRQLIERSNQFEKSTIDKLKQMNLNEKYYIKIITQNETTENEIAMTKYMENQQKQNLTLNNWEYHFVKVKVIKETEEIIRRKTKTVTVKKCYVLMENGGITMKSFMEQLNSDFDEKKRTVEEIKSILRQIGFMLLMICRSMNTTSNKCYTDLHVKNVCIKLVDKNEIYRLDENNTFKITKVEVKIIDFGGITLCDGNTMNYESSFDSFNVGLHSALFHENDEGDCSIKEPSEELVAIDGFIENEMNEIKNLSHLSTINTFYKKSTDGENIFDELRVDVDQNTTSK